MAFTQKKLDTTFTLGQGAFGNSGFNTQKLSGLRASAVITKAGGPSMGTLAMQIYGMELPTMNQLSTLGLLWVLQRRNTIVLEAGDDQSKATVFQGTITSAWADMTTPGDVPFRVEAHTGLIESVQDAEPSSYTGPTDVSTIMSSLATTMGLSFENSGVSVILASPYFYGSPRNQAKACAEAGNFNWIIDNGRLAIWPRGAARGGKAPLISADTGMIGFPAYTSKGISVSTVFNPAIGYGNKIEVQSQQEPASGEWIVYSLDYDLDTLTPNGNWKTTIGATRPEFGIVTS